MKTDANCFHLVHRAEQVLDRFLDDAVAPWRLTSRQLAILQAIAETKGSDQNTIGKHVGMDRSTTAEMMKRLRVRGLIARARRRSDARAYSISLTPDGLATLEAAKPAAVRAEQHFLSLLSHHQQVALCAGLTLMVQQGSRRTAAVHHTAR